jgi:hypothetical protein
LTGALIVGSCARAARKRSHGSQSEHGERTIERLLSASITCRLHKRLVFTYLTAVLTASIRGDPILALT